MLVRYFSHASFQITARSGFRLLTDPWRYNPVAGNMMWQFPTCPIDEAEYVSQDALYISHDHADHYCLRTLAHFDRGTPIVIRRYRGAIAMVDELRRLGFTQIVELDDGESVRLAEDLELTLYVDPRTTDSAIVCTDETGSVFDQNDCMLPMDTARRIGERFDVRIALVCLAAASTYPTFFVMDDDEKHAAWEQRNIKVMDRALDYADAVGAAAAVPNASDMIYFRWPDTDRWYGPLPVELAEHARRRGTRSAIITPAVGDTLDSADPLRAFVPQFADRAGWALGMDELRSRPEVVAIADRLDAWERSFALGVDEFLSRLGEHAHETTEQFDVRFPAEVFDGDGMRVQLRIVHDDGTTTDVGVVMDARRQRVDVRPRALIDPGMLLHVPARYVALVMALEMTWPDVRAGFLRMERPGPLTDDEMAFWSFMNAFTPFLARTADRVPQDGFAERIGFTPQLAGARG